MNFEVAGIMALGVVFVGYFIASPPTPSCAPVEVIRYVRSEPEIHIKEVERIIEKPTACSKADPAEDKVEEPVRRHRRRHYRRWR